MTIGKLEEKQTLAQGTTQGAEELGLTVQTLTPTLAEQLGAEPGEGVVVTAVESGSLAARAGIDAGTLILRVNHKDMHSADDFAGAIRESQTDRRVLLLVRKGDMQRYVALRW